MLKGDKVYLTTLDPANAETVRAWLNDERVNRYLLTGEVPLTASQERAFYEASDAAWTAGTAYRFEIHVAEDGRYIGHVGLDTVDMRHRDASVGIVIGDLASQDNGYGRDAIVTVLRFAFETLGLHRVQIECHATNDRANHLYRSIGFTEVGRRRDAVFTRGEFVDEYVLDMLEDEWRAGPYLPT
jgi:RimJ/RimL family protein N-acetyltransferase